MPGTFFKILNNSFKHLLSLIHVFHRALAFFGRAPVCSGVDHGPISETNASDDDGKEGDGYQACAQPSWGSCQGTYFSMIWLYGICFSKKFFIWYKDLFLFHLSLILFLLLIIHTVALLIITVVSYILHTNCNPCTPLKHNYHSCLLHLVCVCIYLFSYIISGK